MAEAASQERRVRVVDVGFRFRFDDAEVAEALDRRLTGFASDVAGPRDFDLRLDPGGEDARSVGRVHDVTRTGPNQFRLVRRGLLSAAVSRETGLGTVRLQPSRWTVDSLIRLLLSVELPYLDGALVHAAGTVVDGRALLFPGVSGAGKSTLLDHVGGNPLSDEMVGLRRAKAGYRAHSTPFHRLHEFPDRPTSAPLAGIVFPDRSLPTGLHRLEPASAVYRLLQAFVCYGEDTELDRRLLDVACQLVAAVPCHALSFSLGEPVEGYLQQIRGTS